MTDQNREPVEGGDVPDVGFAVLCPRSFHAQMAARIATLTADKQRLEARVADLKGALCQIQSAAIESNKTGKSISGYWIENVTRGALARALSQEQKP